MTNEKDPNCPKHKKAEYNIQKQDSFDIQYNEVLKLPTFTRVMNVPSNICETFKMVFVLIREVTTLCQIYERSTLHAQK